MKVTEVKPGVIVTHNKGGVYKIIGMAKHTEEEDLLVLYHPFGDPTLVWARPLDMFIDGRFRIMRIGEDFSNQEETVHGN